MPVTETTREPTLLETLGGALERDLRVPLAAVRAALESLAPTVDEPARGVLTRTLEGLAEVDRGAEALGALLDPPPIAPQTSSLREIVEGARAALPSKARDRLWIAVEPGPVCISIDAVAVIRSLAFLLAEAIEHGGEVLLHAHGDDEWVSFSIIDDLAASDLDPQSVQGRVHSLGRLLAKSELRRLGAELCEHCAGEHFCTDIRFVHTHISNEERRP